MSTRARVIVFAAAFLTLILFIACATGCAYPNINTTESITMTAQTGATSATLTVSGAGDRYRSRGAWMTVDKTGVVTMSADSDSTNTVGGWKYGAAAVAGWLAGGVLLP